MSSPRFTTIRKDSSPAYKLAGLIDYINHVSWTFVDVLRVWAGSNKRRDGIVTLTGIPRYERFMTARSRCRSLLRTIASADMSDILRAEDNKDLVDINAV